MESKRFRPLQPTGMRVLHGSTCIASTLGFLQKLCVRVGFSFRLKFANLNRQEGNPPEFVFPRSHARCISQKET